MLNMTMARERGRLVYKVYRLLTYAFTPLVRLHLRWRRSCGLEHQTRWPERLGRPSLPRPPGCLIWFHAVSLGEGMAALPLIKRCIVERPDFNVLMTTATVAAFETLIKQLPGQVIYQSQGYGLLPSYPPRTGDTMPIFYIGGIHWFAPLDLPGSIDAFLEYWKPKAVILMESELWPNLIMGASKSGIMLALVNARISNKSLKRWSIPAVYPLISLMLSKFTLIIPLSKVEAVHYQLLQAPPMTVSISADLKYCVGDCSVPSPIGIEDLQSQLACRRIWMASSIHEGEEEVMLGVHSVLVQSYPEMVTILAPRHPQHGREIAMALRKQGVNVALRSNDKLLSGANIYVVDTLGELRSFYRLAQVAVVGGSFLPHLKGHNVSEAAAAGCAVLTGPHNAHFSHMVSTMQQLNPQAIVRVSGRLELEKALMSLFSDANSLEAHRSAARQAFNALSKDVVGRVWKLLDENVLQKALSRNQTNS